MVRGVGTDLNLGAAEVDMQVISDRIFRGTGVLPRIILKSRTSKIQFAAI